MKCPYCQREIADNSFVCIHCQKELRRDAAPPTLQVVQPPPLPNQGVFVPKPVADNDDKCLSFGEKVLVWLGVWFLTLIAALIIGIYYNKIKKTKPIRAASLNRTSWIAFICAILLFWVGPFLLITMDGTSDNTPQDAYSSEVVLPSSDTSFEQYVQQLRDANASPDVQITSDNNSHRIYITQKTDNMASELDTTVIKRKIVESFTGNPDNRQEIEIIKAVNAVLVYRYLTSDGATVDVSIFPADLCPVRTGQNMLP